MYFHACHAIIIGVRYTPTNSKGGKNMTESKTKLNLSIDPTLKKQAQAVIDNKKTTFSKVVTDYLKAVVKANDIVDVDHQFVIVMHLVEYARDMMPLTYRTKVFSDVLTAQEWILNHFDGQDAEIDRDSQGRIVTARTTFDGDFTKEQADLAYKPVISSIDHTDNK